MNHAQELRLPQGRHIAWVDHAKGFTMILVVMLYATDWVQEAAGADSWLRVAVCFAQPFRMPDFFFLSGALLALSIGRDWFTYVDRKVVHFAYFYVLWLVILLLFESPWIAEEYGWTSLPGFFAASLIHPYSLLWFIYLLPIFFVATKLLRGLPALAVWLLAAGLQIANLDSGIKVLDKFMPYYVFFYSGFVLAPGVFKFADAVRARPWAALCGLAAWAVAEALAVGGGHAELPGVSLALGLLGALAVIALCALLSGTRLAEPLAYCGRHSIAIYLAFYIPLVIGGKLLFSAGWIPDLGTIAVLATAVGVIAPLLLHRLVEGTRLDFLFKRPARFWLRRSAVGEQAPRAA